MHDKAHSTNSFRNIFFWNGGGAGLPYRHHHYCCQCVRERRREGGGGTKEGGRGSQATAAVTQISSHCLLLLPDHMKSHCTEKFCPAAWKALGCIEQNCTVMKITTLRCIEKYRVLMMTWKAHQLEHHFARLNTARKRANRDITKKHCGQSSEQITQMYLCYICHFPSRPTSTPTSLQ